MNTKTLCAFQLVPGQYCYWGGRKYFRSYTDEAEKPNGTKIDAGVYLYPVGGHSLGVDKFRNKSKGWFVGWNAKVEVEEENGDD